MIVFIIINFAGWSESIGLVHQLDHTFRLTGVTGRRIPSDDNGIRPNCGPVKVIFTLTFSILLLSLSSRLCLFNVPVAVVKVLNRNSQIRGWVLFRIVNAAMFSFREKKTAWVFRCWSIHKINLDDTVLETRRDFYISASITAKSCG